MKVTPSNTNKPVGRVKITTAINRKTVIAVGLIIIMLFMWIRLFTSGESGPEKADGGTTMPPVPVTSQADTGFSRIELPVVSGRNDEITFDMFTKAGWKDPEDEKVTVETNEAADLDLKSQEARIKELAGSLQLGAIIDGGAEKGYEAFVDGELLSVGSKLPIKHEGRTYVFTVVDILKDRVILKWKEFTIAIKML